MPDNKFDVDAFFEERERKRTELRERQARRRTKVAGKGAAITAAQEGKPWLDLDDAALFIPRAAEGFVRSIGSLLPGLDFGDNRLLGRSDTVVGAGLESITQFGLGFVPALGLVKSASLLAKAGNLGSKAQSLATSAVKGAEALKHIKGGRFVLAAGEGATASAIADFVSFDGHEENLSAVLNAVPALQPLIPDFLATNKDQGEVINRMRNVLEGLGMGAALGVLVEGLRGVIAGRKGLEKAAGRTLTEEETKEALTSSVDAGRLSQGLDEIHAKRSGRSRERLEALAEEEADTAAKATAEATEPVGTPQTLKTTGPDISDSLPAGRTAERRKVGDQASKDELLRSFGSPTENGGALIESIRRRLKLEVDPTLSPKAKTVLGADGAMRAPNSSELLEELITSEHNNLAPLLSDPDKGMVWVIRSLEDVGLLDKPAKVSAEEWANSVNLQILSYAHNVPKHQMMDALVKEAGDVADTISNASLRGEALGQISALNLAASAREMRAIAEGGDLDHLRRLANLAVNDSELARGLIHVKSKLGEGLERVKHWSETGEVAEEFHRRMLAAREAGSEVLDAYLEDFTKAVGTRISTKDWLRAKELADMGLYRQVMVMTQEYYINSILGGFKTLTVQPLSGALLAITLPMEQMVGGKLMRNNPAVKRAIRELGAMTTVLSESALWARRTFKENKSFIAGEGLTEGLPGASAFRAGALMTKPGTPLGTAMNYLGVAVGGPSRLIKTADEFIKQMTSRASLISDFTAEAMENEVKIVKLNPAANLPDASMTIVSGRKRTQAEIEDYVRSKMKSVFHEGHMMSEVSAKKRAFFEGVEKGIEPGPKLSAYVKKNWEEYFDPSTTEAVKRAERRAKDATLQSDFGPDTWEARGQLFLNSHPVLRFVVPFYKTPLNVGKFVGQRTDVIGVARWMMSKIFDPKFKGLQDTNSRFIRDMVSGVPEREAAAAGRIATGSALTMLGGMYASSGMITGRGPSGKEERQALVDSGWQPYSIKTPGGYISYAKAEPYATFFGMMADFTDSARLAGEDGDADAMEVFTAILSSFSNNFTQKSFLQGLGQFIEAVGDPDNLMEPFIENYAGAIVPSNLAQMTAVFGDEALKDTHGILERWISRIPGLSDTATPRRNMFGEVVDRSKSLGEDSIGAFYGTFVPIAYREVSSDPIRQELANLKHGFAAPRVSVQGVDLRDFKSPSGQHAHDRWAQLHGTVKVGGKTMRQTISNLINSRKYQKLTSESTVQDDSPRVQLLRSVLSRFRAKAFQQMLDEYPEAARAIQDREEATERRKRGLAAL